MPSSSLFTLLIAALATTYLAGLTSAQEPERGFADPVLGRWDLTVGAGDDSYPSWLEVGLRTENELHGRFVGRFGSVRYAREVTFESGRLVAVIPVQYEENAEDLRFEGTLSDDTLQGTTQDADGNSLKWTGVRAPALRRDAPPQWGESVELFNGSDLNGWRTRSDDHAGCWSVTDGTLVATPPCVDLISDRAFDDFKLHVEFVYPAGSNSGLYLRGRYEVQIQDDAGWALDPLRMGGIYGFLMPWTDAARKPGEWQTYDITLVGRDVTVALNGTTIIDRENIPGITGGALDSREGEPGPLMLQGDHGKITFRKVTITPSLTRGSW